MSSFASVVSRTSEAKKPEAKFETKKPTATMCCTYCKNGGEPYSVYSTHFVKDKPGPDAKVVCPKLLAKQSHSSYQPAQQRTGMFCSFCKGTDHFTKDKPGPDGKVVCPVLLETVCHSCGEKGHVPKFCPAYVPHRYRKHSDASEVDEEDKEDKEDKGDRDEEAVSVAFEFKETPQNELEELRNIVAILRNELTTLTGRFNKMEQELQVLKEKKKRVIIPPKEKTTEQKWVASTASAWDCSDEDDD